MDEAADAGGAGGVDDRHGAGDIAAAEAVATGRADHPRDVDDRVGAIDELRQRGLPLERAVDPLDAVTRRTRRTRERAHPVALGKRGIDEVAADEPGASGDRERAVPVPHSSTIWSRWTSAARGA